MNDMPTGTPFVVGKVIRQVIVEQGSATTIAINGGFECNQPELDLPGLHGKPGGTIRLGIFPEPP